MSANNVQTRVDAEKADVIEIWSGEVRDILIVVREAAHRCANGDCAEVVIDWRREKTQLRVEVRR